MILKRLIYQQVTGSNIVTLLCAVGVIKIYECLLLDPFRFSCFMKYVLQLRRYATIWITRRTSQGEYLPCPGWGEYPPPLRNQSFWLRVGCHLIPPDRVHTRGRYSDTCRVHTHTHRTDSYTQVKSHAYITCTLTNAQEKQNIRNL